MTAEENSRRSRRRRREWWPLAAAGLAVLAALAAVYVLLHPHRAAASPAEGSPATVTVESAVMRAQPSPRAAAIATLSNGSRVRILADRGLWVEVETDDGGRGHLPGDAVERDADRDARQGRAKRLLSLPPVYGVVAEDTDIALAPYPLAARGGRLRRGTVVAIHSVDHSYFAFENKTWGLAFVPSASVDLVPPDPRLPAITPEKVRPLKDLTIVDLEGEPPPEDEAAVEEAPAAREPVPGAPPAEPPPGLVEPPVLLSRVEPVYPEGARRAGVEGTVELEISIDTAGRVTEVGVARGLPLGLSEAAAAAVRRWLYRPARTRDGPVAARKTVRIRFLLAADAVP